MLKNSANVDLYADDTTIYDVQCNIDQLESNLQFSLNALHVWCRQNGMVLNTEKQMLCWLLADREEATYKIPIYLWDITKLTSKWQLSVKYWVYKLMKICYGIISFSTFPKTYLLFLWLLSKIRQYLSKEHSLLFYNAYIKPHFRVLQYGLV